MFTHRLWNGWLRTIVNHSRVFLLLSFLCHMLSLLKESTTASVYWPKIFSQSCFSSCIITKSPMVTVTCRRILRVGTPVCKQHPMTKRAGILLCAAVKFNCICNSKLTRKRRKPNHVGNWTTKYLITEVFSTQLLLPLISKLPTECAIFHKARQNAPLRVSQWSTKALSLLWRGKYSLSLVHNLNLFTKTYLYFVSIRLVFLKVICLILSY